MLRLPLAIMGAVLVLLVAITVAAGDWSDEPAADAGGELPPIATIAKRVEAIRGLRFREIPVPKTVTGAEAKREATADAARPEAAKGLAAESAVYATLGLVPPGTDLQEVTAGLFDGAVAGYYDPRDGRLRIIESALTRNRVLGETTIAHELTHALDDQRFELDTGELDDGGDRALAYTAMVEGSATSAQTDYQSRFISAQDAIASLGAAFGPTGTEGLPNFLTAQLLFSYLSGETWVSALREKGGWKLVDLAIDQRPPVSTEQVLHPEKWLAAEAPDRVRLKDPTRALGGAFRVSNGTFGEWQTRQLLATGGGGGSQAAAAGWGGDDYALWRTGNGPCSAPCTDRDTLIMRWRWDTPKDAREFTAALRTAAEGLYGERESAYRVTGGATPTLVVAPDAATVDRVLERIA